MAVAISCAAISSSSSSSAIRTSTLGFRQSGGAAAIPRPPRKLSWSLRNFLALESFSAKAGSIEGLTLSRGVYEVEDELIRKSSNLGVACGGDRKREQGLRRLRAGGGKSEVEDGDGLSVKDMERYLDELSIEYDSVWDTKPAWCQPWTIALTGVVGISASWLLVHSVVLTAVVSVLVSAWWFLFLYSYPLAYAQMIAQRRKDQKDGLEDTFGTRRTSD